MSPAEQLRRMLDTMELHEVAEDADQPHVAIAYDPELGADGPLAGIRHVRGPYPSAADAYAAAVTWCEQLGAGNGPDDQPWLPGIARLWNHEGQA